MSTKKILEIIKAEIEGYDEAAQGLASNGHFTEAGTAKIKSLALKNISDKIAAALPPKSQSSHGVKITRPTRSHRSGGKDWSIDPSLTPSDIDRILGRKDLRVSDDPYKVKFSWYFIADGHEMAIWDYKGARWSGGGSREIFDKLGLTVVD